MRSIVWRSCRRAFLKEKPFIILSLKGAIMKKRYIWIACGTLLMFSALACNSIPFLAPTPTPTVTPTSTPTSTPTRSPTPTRTATPTGIPGITMPVTVEDVDLQFVSLRTVSHWILGSTDYTPKSSSDTFLVVKADVLTSGTAYVSLKDWEVSLNGDNSWAFNHGNGDLSSIDSIEWVFVVSQSESSFTINLPGGVDVVLDSLY
jgi:hypothetical protein